MNDLPEHELLSAYLDGELTAEEHAQAERLLAGSPAARQLLEELRALRTTLQALPAQRLDEDLSQRVLRLAERRMLSEPAPREVEETEPAWTTVVRRSIGRQVRSPRTWLWPIVAVAAALLLWIRSPEVADRQLERQLAKAPEAGAAAEVPTIQASPEAAPLAEVTEAGEPLGAVGRPRDQGAAGDLLATDVAPTHEASKINRGRAADALAGSQSPMAGKPAAPPTATSAAVPLAGEPAANATGPAARQQAEHERGGAVVRRSAGLPSDMPGAKADRPPLLVVSCGITAEAAEKRLFEQILRPRLAEEDLSPAKDKRRLVSPGASAAAQKPALAMQRVRKDNADRPAEVWYVEFEATRGELVELFKRLKDRPEVFVSVPDPSELGPLASDLRPAEQDAQTLEADSAPSGDQEKDPQGQSGRQIRLGKEMAEQAAPAEGQPQALSAPGPQFGAAGQSPQLRAPSQVRIQAQEGDTALPDEAKAAPEAATYRVRFELRVVSPKTVPADTSQERSPAKR